MLIPSSQADRLIKIFLAFQSLTAEVLFDFIFFYSVDCGSVTKSQFGGKLVELFFYKLHLEACNGLFY